MGVADAAKEQLLGLVVALNFKTRIFKLNLREGGNEFAFGVLVGDDRFEDDGGRILDGLEHGDGLGRAEGVSVLNAFHAGDRADIASVQFLDGIEALAGHHEEGRELLNVFADENGIADMKNARADFKDIDDARVGVHDGLEDVCGEGLIVGGRTDNLVAVFVLGLERL